MRLLRRDTIASHDRFRQVEARQNLALYYKIGYLELPAILSRGQNKLSFSQISGVVARWN